MKIWWSRVISNENLWEMTGQININKEIRKRKFGWKNSEKNVSTINGTQTDPGTTLGLRSEKPALTT
jgi:hypothetical protein